VAILPSVELTRRRFLAALAAALAAVPVLVRSKPRPRPMQTGFGYDPFGTSAFGGG
jgi:hypothetical protein